MSRLRAEVLRNFLSVNRGIKEGAGASRPVLARVGRLRAAVSLAVPALGVSGSSGGVSATAVGLGRGLHGLRAVYGT